MADRCPCRHSCGHRDRAHDHVRGGGDRHRPGGRRSRSPRRRVLHRRDRRAPPDRSAARARRSSRSTPRQTARRRTSWSTAPIRRTFWRSLDGPGPWHRVLGIRANASTKSHAELDESEVLDDGDPVQLAEEYLAIGERLPHLTVLGGCCGTDHRHVGSVADAWFGAPPRLAASLGLRGEQVGDADLLGEQRAEARRVAGDVALAEIPRRRSRSPRTRARSGRSRSARRSPTARVAPSPSARSAPVPPRSRARARGSSARRRGRCR